jgi:uncharacterized delta-60 repeat protein
VKASTATRKVDLQQPESHPSRRGTLSIGLLLACLVVGMGMHSPTARGAAGALDPTFSGNGKVALRFAHHGPAGLRDVAIQADGKLVAVGFWRARFAVLRFRRNGALDHTFGGDGKVATRFPNGARAWAVAIQNDGKIVAAGTAAASGPHLGWFALARYLPDGQLDPTFGGGDGIMQKEFSRRFDECNSVAIQPDGKIVVAGGRSLAFTGSDFAIMRFNVDGSLDHSFDGDGKQAINLSADPSGDLLDVAHGVVVQPDNKIVLGGTVQYGGPAFRRGFALVRLNADGSPDSSFGTDGKSLSPLPSSESEVSGLALGSDGKLTLVGDTVGFAFRSAVARFDSGGALDTSFSDDGLVTTKFPGEYDSFGSDVEVQPDGRTVAVGSAGIDFAVARYNVDGTLDTAFSDDGRVTTSWKYRWGGTTAFAAALQPDGKIVAAGDTIDANILLLTRYLGN